MKKTRKCAFCGREFTCNSGAQKYCCEECAEAAKAQRKKRQHDFLNAVQPVIDISSQEYLTFAKAAILMGCTRQYVYKLVNGGRLPASRISRRMSLIRKSDIETLLTNNPYYRVIPTDIAKTRKPDSCTSSHSPSQSKSKNGLNGSNGLNNNKGKSLECAKQSDEPLEYISAEEVMDMYKVKKTWLWTSAKRNGIPICRIAGRNYYSKKHLDEVFSVPDNAASVTEWIATRDAAVLYATTVTTIRSQASRKHVPTKREYGQTFYSKTHLDEIYRPDLATDDRYCTTAEAAEKYGMTKCNICMIVKKEHLTKVKLGVRNLILREEIDGIMAERMARFGTYHLQ